MKTRRNQGFTLIEILVVIGIIAVLAAIVLVALNPARQFALARQSQRTSNVNAILNAVGQYIADNQGDLPDALSIPTTEGNISDTGENLCDDLVDEYMPALPVDPNDDVSNDGGDGDGQVSEGECGGSYDTGYTVEVDDNGRVTICAPESENEDAIEDAELICVTR